MATYDVMDNTTNAKFIPTIISQKAIGRFPSYLNLAKTVSRDSDWTTAQVGTTIRVPKRGSVSANDKSAGEIFTKQNPTATDVYVTLNKHKEVTLTIDDVTKVVENQDTLNGYAEDAAIALAEAVETELAALHPEIENTDTFVKTSEDTIDLSLLRVRKYFTDQKVPLLEQKYMYVDSTVYNELLGVDKYTRYDARGVNPSINEALLLKTYGIEIHESQLIQVSGSPVAYHNLAYTKNAFVLASRPLPQPANGSGVLSSVINDASVGLSLRSLFWYNGDLGAHQLTLDLLFGVAVLDQRRVIEIEST
jgi:hypothetical protein